MHIGPYQLTAIETGYLALDGGAMFGVIPKNLWQKSNPADETNRIQLALRTLLLVSPERKILIDTGVGAKFNEKLKKIYNIDHSLFSLESSLAQAGISPNEITDVILSHLHFDHCGGSTSIKNNQTVPTFPNARYIVQKEQWDWAHAPSEKDRASFQNENYDPIQSLGLLHLIDGPSEIFPGVECFVMHGHTPGMQLVKIFDVRQSLVYCADLIPTSSHIPVPWIMAYDNNPMITIAEKKQFLSTVLDRKAFLFFEHDPLYAAGTVNLGDRGYFLDSAISTEEFNSR